MTDFKVHMGTPQGRTSLCTCCAYAQHIHGKDLQEEIHCLVASPRRQIKFPVHTCTTFMDARLPSLEDMKKIAWTVESRPKRGKWGFDHEKDKDQNPNEVTIEPPRKIVDIPGEPLTVLQPGTKWPED